MLDPNILKLFPAFLSSSGALGLDLGNFSVKLVQIKKKAFNQDKFLSYALTPVKPEASREDYIAAIKQARQQLSTDARKVNISVCGPNVIIRYIILPLMQEKDLKKSLEFELDKYIPFKRESAIVDYRIVANLSNNQMVVLVVAVEERFVEEKVKLVRDAGLETELVNVDAFALLEAFTAGNVSSGGVSAILDIGYHFSKLAVFESNVPYFSRDIEIGEREIFQILSEKVAVDLAMAKAYSYDPPLDKIKEITDAMNSPLTSLLNELSLSFEYCERDLEKKVGRLYLTGGGSRIKVLADTLKSIPDLKIDVWNPLKDFKIAPASGSKNLEDASLLLGVSTGLALC